MTLHRSRPRYLLRRLLTTCSAITLAAGLLTLAAPSAQAATWCGTRSVTWYLSDAAVSLRIMTIKTYLEVCTDDRSIVSTSETTHFSFTGPGVTTGWVGGYGPAVRTQFSSCCSANYRAEGFLKDCASHWAAIFCSRAEDFLVNSSISMAPIIFVRPSNYWQSRVGHRVFTWSFTPHNLGHARIRFNNTI